MCTKLINDTTRCRLLSISETRMILCMNCFIFQFKALYGISSRQHRHYARCTHRCRIYANEKLFISTNLVYVIVIKSWSVDRVKCANECQRWKCEMYITLTWDSRSENHDDRVILPTDISIVACDLMNFVFVTAAWWILIIATITRFVRTKVHSVYNDVTRYVHSVWYW